MDTSKPHKVCGDNAKQRIREHRGTLTGLVQTLKAWGYKDRSIRYHIKQLRPDLWASRPQEAQATLPGTSVSEISPEAPEVPLDEKSTGQDKPLAAGCVEAPDERRRVLHGKRFVMTVAQNNTHVHKGFLDALRVYCKENAAELLVARCTYNKNGFQNLSKESEGLWYDPELLPHLVETESFMLSGPHLDKFIERKYEPIVFCAELDILPTAIRPLSGLQNYTREHSCVVPHVKVAMESVPTNLGTEDNPKMMYTTGAVTQRNYIQRKTGQKADFHHVYGALVVEFNEDNGHWYARQLAASTHGSFYDLDKYYSAEGVTTGHRPLTMVCGDVHLPHRTPNNSLSRTFAHKDSPLHVLKPRDVFLHDCIDFYAQNHHNRKNMRHRIESSITVKGASAELDRAKQDLLLIYENCKNAAAGMHLVWSNHMDALVRWVEEAQWSDMSREDAELLLRLQRKAVLYPRNGLPSERDSADVAIFKEAVGFYPLERSNTSEVKGVLHGLHGHLGPNGARGNPANLNNIGRKVTCGHGHSARILDGVYQVGVTCPVRLNYNKGPQAWSITHCIMYPNGKRSLITIKGTAWKA